MGGACQVRSGQGDGEAPCSLTAGGLGSEENIGNRWTSNEIECNLLKSKGWTMLKHVLTSMI